MKKLTEHVWGVDGTQCHGAFLQNLSWDTIIDHLGAIHQRRPVLWGGRSQPKVDDRHGWGGSGP